MEFHMQHSQWLSRQHQLMLKVVIIFIHFRTFSGFHVELGGCFTTVKPRIPLKNIHPLPCFWWNLLHTPGFIILKYTPKCEELPQVAYTSRAAQKHPNNSQHRILDLRRHNRPLQTNMAPENFCETEHHFPNLLFLDRILPPLSPFAQSRVCIFLASHWRFLIPKSPVSS